MKPGLKHWLEVELVGMDPFWEDVQQIEILFQQNKTRGVFKSVLWVPGDTEDCKRGDDNTLLILWTREETRQFKENDRFYMDIRPTMTNGLDLHVDPVELCMTWTLFKDAEGSP